jgi:hypothetical protein
MLNLNNASITKVVAHKVGHDGRNIKNTISRSEVQFGEQLAKDILRLIQKEFRDNIQPYQFSHTSDLFLNEIFSYSKNAFNAIESFHEQSVNILKHLYRESKYPNIKTGDVILVYIDSVEYDNRFTEAIAILKSERKDSFIKFEYNHGSVNLVLEEGLSISKVDKSALIVNVNSDKGFNVYVGEKHIDTEYWKNDFLQIKMVAEEAFQTKSFLDLMNNFSKEYIAPHFGKNEQVSFVGSVLNELTNNPSISTDKLLDSFVENDEIKSEFIKYRKSYEMDNEMLFPSEISLSQPMLKQTIKKIKNEIRLDTNIQIKIDINQVQNVDKYIERGFDKEKGMSFYKIFFNLEN